MLKTTPFHPRTAPLVQGNAWRRWSGYSVASAYELQHEREYAAIRSAAALIDVSPLCKYLVSGPDAARLLDRMVTRDVTKCRVGQVMYTPWCDARGKVIDDGTVSRLGESRYRLTSAEPNLRWLSLSAAGMDVTIEDVSERTAALALQGPLSRAVLEQASGHELGGLRYFRLQETRVRGIPVTISRTGYTGDLGFELWVDAGRAVPLWAALIPAGAGQAVDRARGQGARRRTARAQGRAAARAGMGIGGARRGLGLARGPLCAGRAPAPAAGGGVADQRAGLPRRRPDRVRHQRVLVAAAQAIPGARPPARAVVRPGHRPPPRGDRGAPEGGGGRAGYAAAVLQSRPEAGVTPRRYDVVLVGAGHNALVAAAYLARAGRRVLVLERRPIIGGAAVTEEIFPGFKFSVFSYVVSLLRPEIIRDLDLPRHGLQILPLESTVVPLDGGDHLGLWGDPDRSRRGRPRHSPRDAEAARIFGRLMQHMAMAVKPILGMVPPDPASPAPPDLSGLLRLGGHFRSLGAERVPALHKLMTMSSADYLDEWFEFDPLKATKSASGIIGTFLGPRSPGSAYVLLHHYVGRSTGRSGPGASRRA